MVVEQAAGFRRSVAEAVRLVVIEAVVAEHHHLEVVAVVVAGVVAVVGDSGTVETSEETAKTLV